MLDQLRVTRVGGALELDGVRAELERGAIDWSVDGGREVRWGSAKVLVAAHEVGSLEGCRLSELDRAQGELVCATGNTSVDLAAAEGEVRSARDVVQRVRSEWQRARASTSGSSGAEATIRGAATGSSASDTVASGANVESAGPSAAGALLDDLRLSVRVEGGRVALSRGTTVIAAFEPASADAEVRGRALQSAHVQLGAAGDDGTAVRLGYTRVERDGRDPSWRIDLQGEGLPLGEVARWVRAVPWHEPERGRVRLNVHAEPETTGVVAVEGDVALENAGFFHRGVAREPVTGLSVAVRGSARIDAVHRRIESRRVDVAVNGVRLEASGSAERLEDHYAVDVLWNVPTMGCDALRRSLPATVVGAVGQLSFAGSLRGSGRIAIDSRQLGSTVLDVFVDEDCAVVEDPISRGMRRFSGPFVQRVQEPTGPRAFVTGPGTAAWVALPEVSPYVVQAVLSREDGRFYRHHGFDLHEIRGALVRNLAAGRYVYGASTLSMQLAKNVFLEREKTLVRKLQEVVFTWYLERALGKDGILELYLNVVEFGPGIYGIGPASRFFFGREPSELTPLQSIYIATLLPSPVARFGNYQRGSVSSGTLAGLRAHARLMGSRGMLSPEELAFSQQESLVFRPATARTTGALTQDVPMETTDSMASRMVPPPITSAVAARGSGEVTEDEQPEGDGAGLDENAEETTGARRGGRPVVLRLGGSI